MYARFLFGLYSACRHEPPYWGAPGGTPPAPSFPPFLREEMGAPAAQARPRGAPITAGDHRSPLHRRPKLRIIRFRVNAKAHSLRWASSPHDDHSVGSPRGPHWVRRVVPQGTFSCPVGAIHLVAPHGASGFGDKRADDIRPYIVSSYPPVARGTPALRRHGTDGGPAGQAGTAQRLSGPAGWSMRAAQGAAAPVTKPKKEPGVDARPVLALSVQLSAAMNPRIGGSRVGEAPRPFFPPISSGRNGGARRAGIRREAGPPPDGRILSAPTGLAVGVPRWAGPPPGDAPVSGQKSAPPGIRAALVFTALRGNTPNQGWQAAACRGCCAGR